MTIPNTHKPIGGFPSNPATALIIAEIADQLQRISHEGSFAEAIRRTAKQNPKEIIRILHHQIQDGCKKEIDDVIGYKLVDKIEKLFV